MMEKVTLHIARSIVCAAALAVMFASTARSELSQSVEGRPLPHVTQQSQEAPVIRLAATCGGRGQPACKKAAKKAPAKKTTTKKETIKLPTIKLFGGGGGHGGGGNNSSSSSGSSSGGSSSGSGSSSD